MRNIPTWGDVPTCVEILCSVPCSQELRGADGAVSGEGGFRVTAVWTEGCTGHGNPEETQALPGGGVRPLRGGFSIPKEYSCKE